MLKIINNIIDRCFFTITFILGIQLPEYIKQYQQRLAGHLDESVQQLKQFNDIAKQHFNGDLVTMVRRYKENNEASIVNTGEVIETLTQRTQYLTAHLEQISTTDYLTNVYQFIINIDKQIAIKTGEQFTMAIPLELNAIVTGAILAIGALIVRELFLGLFRLVFQRKSMNYIAD